MMKQYRINKTTTFVEDNCSETERNTSFLITKYKLNLQGFG